MALENVKITLALRDDESLRQRLLSLEDTESLKSLGLESFGSMELLYQKAELNIGEVRNILLEELFVANEFISSIKTLPLYRPSEYENISDDAKKYLNWHVVRNEIRAIATLKFFLERQIDIYNTIVDGGCSSVAVTLLKEQIDMAATIMPTVEYLFLSYDRTKGYGIAKYLNPYTELTELVVVEKTKADIFPIRNPLPYADYMAIAASLDDIKEQIDVANELFDGVKAKYKEELVNHITDVEKHSTIKQVYAFIRQAASNTNALVELTNFMVDEFTGSLDK